MIARATHRGLPLLVMLGLLLSLVGPASAQGGGSDPVPNGNTTVHVVQRGETLYRIALQYGSTVDAISAANGILDPSYLTVGQRLLIPNAQAAPAAPVVYHTIAPGDSLDILAAAYNTTLERLSADNAITNPRMVYIGQTLTINTNSEPTPSTPRHLYYVRPGENLARIALANGISLSALAQANKLSSAHPLFPGQRLWLPGESSQQIKDLPPPFVDYTLTPIPAIQGQTIGIHVSTTGPATVTGTFMGDVLQIVTQDATEHYALIGVHTFTVPGVYPLNLVATTPDDTRTRYQLNLSVVDGDYGTETIALTNEQQDLLNTDVTEPEWQRVATLMSGFTAHRYFDGMMGLPSSGGITSEFGTRRSYNSGTLNSFHSGTDFGGGPGSSILAPAAGVVVMAEALPVRGNATIIDHGWGVLTGYWHQEQIMVQVGDVVTAGQVIGTVGTTGRSTGPHLHWEMWVSGVQVDPMQWVQQTFH